MDFFGSIDAAWWWVAIGLALAALELLVPGVYLIWLAVAALGTGLIAMVADFGLAVQVVNFVFLALIAVYSGKRWFGDKAIVSDDPLLNHRGLRLVGETAVVARAIEGGEGRVRHGDSEWIARGADAKVGARVRITGVKGPILEVEPVSLIESHDAEPTAD